MKIRCTQSSELNSEQLVASFGAARLVQDNKGKCHLRDAGKAERTAAKEWISIFMHEAIVRIEN